MQSRKRKNQKSKKEKEKDMTPNEYQHKAIMFITTYSHRFEYLITGLGAETGEVLDKYAKAIRAYGDIWAMDEYDRKIFTENISRELGDVLWFVACLIDRLGLNMEEVMQQNISKLEDRKQRNVIIGDGDNR